MEDNKFDTPELREYPIIVRKAAIIDKSISKFNIEKIDKVTKIS